MKECITHHNACDCREENFKKMELELSLLYSVLSEYKMMAEDGKFAVEPSCFSAFMSACELKRQRELK